MNHTTFAHTLKLNSLSNTVTRQVVFNALSLLEKPVSMNELIHMCSDIDRVSVYRTINAFEKAGIVNRVNVGWKYKVELSDNFKEHHHHLTCVSCGTIIDFDEPQNLDEELHKIALSKKFILQNHILELKGVCSKCKI